MSILVDFLPDLVSGLVVSGLFIAGGWLAKRWTARRRPQIEVRRYTVLNLVAPNGNPVVHSTTCPAGTVIALDLGSGRAERVRLTGAQLSDGTFAAEPMDRY